MKKKILVTGGSGYKGVKLINALIKNGYSVINIDKNIFGNYFVKNKKVINFKIDICEIKKINLKNVYACIHLASIANDPMVDLDPSLSWETSAVGSQILMEQLIKYKVKKIIYETLQSRLKEYKKQLLDMQKDKHCPAQSYENTLDKCKDLEYAIQQMEKQL